MNPKIIGLTGGIGSGKTTVAGFFAAKGVPVYIADDEAKKLLYQPAIATKVKDVFGDGVMDNTGLPDRQKLAGVVFADAQKLAVLNSIVHPEVTRHFREWVAAHSDFPYVIKEAAILFESGSYKNCDKVITVTAPVDERVRRVLKRDNSSEDMIMQRMQHQWTDEERLAKSDFVIVNDNLQHTEIQVGELIEKLQKLYVH